MSERCGAWQVGQDRAGGPVQFRVLFPAGVDPHVTSIRVAGDFQAALGGAAWDVAGAPTLVVDRTDPRGDFWTAQTSGPLPAGFYEYKYLVTFDDGTERYVTDPCARYGGFRDQNSGVVVGGTTSADNVVHPLAGGRRPLTDLVMYELMIDDFTAEYRHERAPLAAVVDGLDRLVDLGFNAILFMPWTAWKHREFDWGYEPFQFFAIEARYANDLLRPEEKLSWLKRLMNECHRRDLHVIMDGVFNHVSRDFPYQYLYRDPATCPFTAEPFGNSFPGLQDLDFNNAATNVFIQDVCRYWIDNFGIDGIRFDNTVNYYEAGDFRGLPELLADIDSAQRQQGETAFSLTLEHIDLSAATVTNATAATSFWDNSLYGLCFQALWGHGIDSRFLNALNNRRFLGPGKVPTLYLSNHDHSHPAWQAGARDNVGAVKSWWKLQPFVIALYTATATPLIPNGQEFGEEHFIPEDDAGTGRRVSGRPLRWKAGQDPIGRTLSALHRRLARLRLGHPGLRSPNMYPDVWEEWQTQPNPVGVGVDVAGQTVVYHRWGADDGGLIENFAIVLNFAGEGRLIDTPFPLTGQWVDLLAGFDGDPVPWALDVTGSRAAVDVGPHWGRVLWHRP